MRGAVPVLAAALLAAAAAFGLRLGTAESVFRGGGVSVPPFDEAYHARRVLHAAAAFPSLPDPDPRRGASGAFTPWPPLHDLSTAAFARAFGPSGDPLRAAVWVPPLLGAAAAALVAGAAAAAGGFLPGLLAGLLLAVSPAHAGATMLGAIDHHAAEPVALLFLLGATLLAAREGGGAAARGALLGAALLLALFTQTSLLLFAGASFATLLLSAPRTPSAAGAGALGLALAALGVAAWGATRPAGYPQSGWFLGTPHAAVLAGGAAALGLFLLARRRGASRPTAGGLAIAAGSALALAWPGVLPALADGASFLRSDPWLDRIVEFQPLVSGLASLPGAVVLLGGGALLVVPFLLAGSRLGRGDLVLGAWAGLTLAAAFSRARFAVLAATLLALVAGRAVALLAARGRWVAAALAALASFLPLLGTRGRLAENEVLPAHARPVLRAAAFLAGRCGEGERVLAPWSWGHALDLAGGCSVLVDGFGSMPGRVPFEDALAASLTTREERLVRFCRERRVRWVVLTNPLFTLAETAGTAGLPEEAFLATSGGGAPRVTRLAQATVWWRAYFDGRPAPPGLPPLRVLRKAWTDPQPAWEPAPYGGPALAVWEVPPADLP